LLSLTLQICIPRGIAGLKYDRICDEASVTLQTDSVHPPVVAIFGPCHAHIMLLGQTEKKISITNPEAL